MKISNLLLRSFILFSLLLSFSCGPKEASDESKQSAKCEISFLTMQLRPTFDEYFLQLFKEFEQSHPDVKINWLDYPYLNYDTKLMTSFMGKTPPDVINISSETMGTFVEGNFLKELNSLLPKETFDSYLPNMLRDGGSYKGKFYALPWYNSGEVTLFNTAIFKEAGIDLKAPLLTFEEVRDVLKPIREKTGKFGLCPLYTEGGSLRFHLLEVGVPLLDESGTKAAFNTPKGVEALKFWTDLYREGLVPSEALTAMHRRPVELFKTGQLAILPTGAEFIKHVKSDSPDIYKDMIVGPKLHWKDIDINFVFLHTLAVAQKSKHPELAAEFAAFVTNAQNQLRFCKLTTILPSITTALDDPYFTNPDSSLEGQARKYSAAQVKKGIIVIPIKQSRKLYQVFDEIMEKVCTGKMTAEDGLKNTETRWNEILKNQ